MPYKKTAHAEKQRIWVPLRVLGNLLLLVGILLMSITAIIPGVQIVGIPVIMSTGLGMLGTYIGRNFLYGIGNIIIKFAWQSLPEKKALFEFWIEREKPAWFRRNIGRLRYVYFAAFAETVSDLLSETQKALGELAFGSLHFQEFTQINKKLNRLNGLISDIKNFSSDLANFISTVVGILPIPAIKSDNFFSAKERFYQSIKKTQQHETFSQALEAQILEKSEQKKSALSKDEIQAERTVLLNNIIQDAHKEDEILEKELNDPEITLKIEDEGNKRVAVILKTVGSILLTISIVATLTASFSFPILPAALLINILLAGVIMVSIYVISNFGIDTTKSLINITRQYINEKEPIFRLWCKQNHVKPTISWSYFNLYMQMIVLPAMSAACADLITHLKNALSESAQEFLSLPGMGETARLTHLLHTAQAGWNKTFGVSPHLQAFQETEKIVSALLANKRYHNFEEGVLDLENHAEEIKSLAEPKKRKEAARKKLTDILITEIKSFNDKKISPEQKEIKLKNMHRRFQGYERAVRNETLRLLNLPENKGNTAYTQEMAKIDAIENVNKKHPINTYFHFPKEQAEIIDLHKEPDTEANDRQWIPLRILGNLGLATGIILSLLSFAIPALPLVVVPALMGISAMMLITYIAKNFQYNVWKIINQEKNIHQNERIPYFEIWSTTRNLPQKGIRRFFLRLLCTTIPAIQSAIQDINQKLDSSISDLINEGRHISEKHIAEKSRLLHKDLKSLNRFEQLIDRISIDLVPSDFRETEELIDVFLMSKGYDSFESGIKDYMEKYSYNKEDAKTALTKALTDDMTTFNENLKKSINEKNIAKSQAKKTLLTPYYNQYNAHKNETESKKRQEKKEKILKEMTDETIEEDEKVKQERDEKSENDSPAQSPRSENH